MASCRIFPGSTLTCVCVCQLLEDVMREHLGWLVLWGNVFGT